MFVGHHVRVVARPRRLADTAGMAKKPEPTKPISWEILYAGKKPKPLGEVEAADANEAIEKAAKQFNHPPSKLMAVRRR